MSDFGVPSALQNRAIQLFAGGEVETSKRVIAFGFKFLIGVGSVIFLCAALAIAFVPIATWLHGSESLSNELKWALLICVAGFAIGLPSRLGGVLFNVHGWIALPPLFEVIAGLLSLLALAAVAMVKWNSLIALASVFIFGVLVGGFAGTIVAVKKFGYVDVSGPLEAAERAALLNKGGFFFLTNVGELLLLQSDAVLIGILVGPTRVTEILVPLSLLTNFLQIQNVWLRPLWPKLSSFYATGDILELRALIRNCLVASVVGAGAFGVGIIVSGDWFVRLWTHHAVSLPAGLACGLAVYIVVMAIDNVLATFLNAFGRIELRFAYTFGMGVTKVVTAYLLLKWTNGEVWRLPWLYAVVVLTCSLPFAISALSRELKR